MAGHFRLSSRRLTRVEGVLLADPVSSSSGSIALAEGRSDWWKWPLDTDRQTDSSGSALIPARPRIAYMAYLWVFTRRPALLLARAVALGPPPRAALGERSAIRTAYDHLRQPALAYDRQSTARSHVHGADARRCSSFGFRRSATCRTSPTWPPRFSYRCRPRSLMSMPRFRARALSDVRAVRRLGRESPTINNMRSSRSRSRCSAFSPYCLQTGIGWLERHVRSVERIAQRRRHCGNSLNSAIVGASGFLVNFAIFTAIAAASCPITMRLVPYQYDLFDRISRPAASRTTSSIGLGRFDRPGTSASEGLSFMMPSPCWRSIVGLIVGANALAPWFGHYGHKTWFHLDRRRHLRQLLHQQILDVPAIGLSERRWWIDRSRGACCLIGLVLRLKGVHAPLPRSSRLAAGRHGGGRAELRAASNYNIFYPAGRVQRRAAQLRRAGIADRSVPRRDARLQSLRRPRRSSAA